ncbi:hypothetical protein B484DRAFT_393938 [Ochromonadaceae sp. CCMP2298]|nr:hypothetical protein B484DRAFT_393938 [Ochromonadaceae sp. CCMP2298]
MSSSSSSDSSDSSFEDATQGDIADQVGATQEARQQAHEERMAEFNAEEEEVAPAAVEQPGGDLHLLQENAMDMITTFKYKKDSPILDEMAEMIRNSIGLFGMVSAMAWQDVCTQEDRTSPVIVWKLLVTSFDAILEHYPKKQYAQDQLFKHFPDKTWPEDFLAYVDKVRSKDPVASWLAKQKELSHRSSAEQKQALFGSTIRTTSDEIKKFIISRLNTYWVPREDLPSGKTRSDYWATLLEYLWLPDCHRRAVGSVDRANTRKGKELTPHQKLHLVLDARAENVEAGKLEWNGTWSPNSWCAYIHLGLPAAENEGHVMGTLAIGCPGTASAQTGEMANRQELKAKRRADAAGGGGRAAPGPEVIMRKQIEQLKEMDGPIWAMKLTRVREEYLKLTDAQLADADAEVEQEQMTPAELNTLLRPPGEQAHLLRQHTNPLEE